MSDLTFKERALAYSLEKYEIQRDCVRFEYARGERTLPTRGDLEPVTTIFLAMGGFASIAGFCSYDYLSQPVGVSLAFLVFVWTILRTIRLLDLRCKAVSDAIEQIIGTPPTQGDEIGYVSHLLQLLREDLIGDTSRISRSIASFEHMNARARTALERLGYHDHNQSSDEPMITETMVRAKRFIAETSATLEQWKISKARINAFLLEFEGRVAQRAAVREIADLCVEVDGMSAELPYLKQDLGEAITVIAEKMQYVFGNIKDRLQSSLPSEHEIAQMNKPDLSPGESVTQIEARIVHLATQLTHDLERTVST